MTQNWFAPTAKRMCLVPAAVSARRLPLMETEKVEPGMLEVAPTDTAMENDSKKSAIFADQAAVLAVKSCNQVQEDILVSTNGDSITKAAFIPEVDDRVVVIESTTSSSVCCVI